MKYFSLFSGIGAFEKAISNLNISYELVGYSEIDKDASKSYSAIHNVSESLNLGDITKIDASNLPKDIDLITYGFPCQDISISGKMRGLFNEDGTQTRSGLFFDALRIIKETQPKIAIAENVKNLTSKRFSEQFHLVLNSLEDAGYNNYWNVLCAKDYGLPQKRERVFIVSIRKDIDDGKFSFAEPIDLDKTFIDLQETNVDEKYYLPLPSQYENVSERFFRQAIETLKENNCSVGNTIDAFNKKVGDGVYCPTLTTRPEGFKTAILIVSKKNDELCARKITPLECWRVQGFSDEDYYKALSVVGERKLYKQAGNSIAVSVIENGILKKLLRYFIEFTNGECVDCDVCEHRSEDCLCDISGNDEPCPLI